MNRAWITLEQQEKYPNVDMFLKNESKLLKNEQIKRNV